MIPERMKLVENSEVTERLHSSTQQHVEMVSVASLVSLVARKVESNGQELSLREARAKLGMQCCVLLAS